MTLKGQIEKILDTKVKYKHNRVTVLGISDDVPDYSVVIDALLALFRQKALEVVPKKINILKDISLKQFARNRQMYLWRKSVIEEHNDVVKKTIQSIEKAFGEGK